MAINSTTGYQAKIDAPLKNWPKEKTWTNSLVLVGRFFFSLIFIISSFGHFSSATIQYAANQGVALPHILVPISGLIALLGGLSILFGYHARLGAFLIIVFLVPVTLTMHNFWSFTDPGQAQLQQIMFLKNLSMLGGALLIYHFGAGPMSLDRKI